MMRLTAVSVVSGSAVGFRLSRSIGCGRTAATFNSAAAVPADGASWSSWRMDSIAAESGSAGESSKRGRVIAQLLASLNASWTCWCRRS